MTTPFSKLRDTAMTDPAQPVEATPLIKLLRDRATYLTAGVMTSERDANDALIFIQAATALSLAQTENAGHIRIEDELKSDLAQAQARCAELERIIRHIVMLDDDAHPGLSTWNEARSRAHLDAKTAVENGQEEK